MRIAQVLKVRLELRLFQNLLRNRSVFPAGSSPLQSILQPENAGVIETPSKSVSHSVSISEESSRYHHFSDLLREWGFTGTQLVLIDDALKEARLEITPKP